MQTIIFDIDGTITNMWPMEKSVLLAMTNKRYSKKIDQIYLSGITDTYKIYSRVAKKKISKTKYYRFYNRRFSSLKKTQQLPKLQKYPIVDWIKRNVKKYHLVYVTGGQNLETKYVLDELGISKYFDFKNSYHKNNCRFSKITGIPFKKIKQKFPDCLIITDSNQDIQGAIITKIPFIKVDKRSIFWSG